LVAAVQRQSHPIDTNNSLNVNSKLHIWYVLDTPVLCEAQSKLTHLLEAGYCLKSDIQSRFDCNIKLKFDKITDVVNI
jgi:hypothetical protein